MERGSRRNAAVHSINMNFSSQREPPEPESTPKPEYDAESGYSTATSCSDRMKDFIDEFIADRPSAVRRSPQGSECFSSEHSDASCRSNRSKETDCDFNSQPSLISESFRKIHEALLQSHQVVIQQQDVIYQQDVIRQQEVIRQREDSLRQREDSLRQREDSLRQREDSLRQREDSLRQREDSLRQQEVQQGIQKAHWKIINAVGDEQHLKSGKTYSYGFQSEEGRSPALADGWRHLTHVSNSVPVCSTAKIWEWLPLAAALHQRTMPDSKSSVVIFGNGTFLKKDVITNFLGKDLSSLAKREINATTVYETNELEFICTPDVETSREEIKALFSKKQLYDMYLVVVEKGFSLQGAWDLIVDLNKTTGVKTENLFVVLPPQHKQVPESYYPFRFYTFDQVQSKLSELKNKPAASR